MPISRHSFATRTSCSFSGVVFPMMNVKYCGAIHVDDVALLEDVLGLGDAVTHHLVDAGAHALGESLVVEGCRRAAVTGGIVIDYLVNLKG